MRDDVAEDGEHLPPRGIDEPGPPACNTRQFQSTISTAPFSFGPAQNRPQDWSAQMPPRTCRTKLSKVATQRTTYR